MKNSKVYFMLSNTKKKKSIVFLKKTSKNKYNYEIILTIDRI